MRSQSFYPGEKVMAITDYDGVPSGTVGTIVTKWSGTAYLVRIPEGSFHWLSNSEFGSTDPNENFKLEEGDIGVVTSDQHHHDYAKVGDKYKVYKVLQDSEHYGVSFYNKIYYFGNFQLARYQ